MRLKLSALFLSTALATALVGGALVMTIPAATVAVAQVPSEVDVDGLLKMLPADEFKTSYDSKSYDPATGVTTIKGLKLADPRHETENFVVIEQLDLHGIDMEAVNHVFEFAKYGATPDETFKQLVGDVAVRNLAVTVGGQPAGSVEAITFAGLQMKQLQVTPYGAPPADPSAPAPSGKQKELMVAASFLDSIIAGKLEVTNVNIKSPTATVTLGSFSYDGFDRGKWGAIAIDALDVAAANGSAPGGGHFAIGSIRNDGIDISKCIPWLLKAEQPPVTSEPLLYIGATTASGLNFEGEGAKVSVGSYVLDPVNFYWLVPAHLKAVVDDITIVPPAAQAGEMKEMGIEQLNLDYGIEVNFDGDAKTLKLTELRIQELQLFDVVLSFDAVGIDLARLVVDATRTAAATEIGLSFAQLFVKNNGGFEKVLEMAAKEQGTTPDALKQQALAQLTAMEGGMPGPDGQVKPLSDRLKSIVAAVKAFIESPGTITVKVQPASPITAATGMGAMFDPMSAADTLGVTVESTPK